MFAKWYAELNFFYFGYFSAGVCRESKEWERDRDTWNFIYMFADVIYYTHTHTRTHTYTHTHTHTRSWLRLRSLFVRYYRCLFFVMIFLASHQYLLLHSNTSLLDISYLFTWHLLFLVLPPLSVCFFLSLPQHLTPSPSIPLSNSCQPLFLGFTGG